MTAVRIALFVWFGAAIAAATLLLSVPAKAAPGQVSCQSGCVVDGDGYQGDLDSDGTQGSFGPAVTGSSRQSSASSSGGHTIQSDACYVIGDPTYCPPPSSFDPENIEATTSIYGGR